MIVDNSEKVGWPTSVHKGEAASGSRSTPRLRCSLHTALNAAVAQQLVEAAEHDLGDRNVDDLWGLLAAFQKLQERILVDDRLMAAFACQKEPECIFHLSLSLLRRKLQYLEIAAVTVPGIVARNKSYAIRKRLLGNRCGC